MTRYDLPSQEEHLFSVLSSDRFLRMEGLSNEVPFFIYPYVPESALQVDKAKKRIINRLMRQGIEVQEINLYDLTVDILHERGDWSEVLEVEPAMDKAEYSEMLQSMLNPQQHLVPVIRSRLTHDEFDIVFLTGIGEVFPYIRSHNVLNNLQSVIVNKPMLMFFPGTYEQSETLGSSLVLFGLLKDDQYYRAKNILEQEP